LEIHGMFMEHGVFSWSNLMRWFYDEKAWKYRWNKNNFYKNWISDISAIIAETFCCIEVKKPSEMSFFDRKLPDLKKRFTNAQKRNLSKETLKKYKHAIDQREFLDNVIKNGWVWFFASSVEQVIERLKEEGFEFS
jgi:hypothetical protein